MDSLRNLKKLPIVKECEIIKEEKENLEEYKNEVQEAINLVAKNDTSHIRKLSELATLVSRCSYSSNFHFLSLPFIVIILS